MLAVHPLSRERFGSYVLVGQVTRPRLSPRDHAPPSHTLAQTAESGDKEKAADWYGLRVAPTALPA